ncbi:MAG TPA: hypothetical protein VEK57_19085 [Thermoanaerobaculia bacterium]|nr:hypothetical protein [Thermoanaerobaculia bacterium]
MNPTLRNTLGILAAISAGYITLAVAASIDYALQLPMTASTAAGAVVMQLIGGWPHLVASAVFGGIAAVTVAAPRSRVWLYVVGGLAAAFRASSYFYIAPVWQAWATTFLEVAVVAAIAAGVFALVARRYGRSARQQNPGIAAAP